MKEEEVPGMFVTLHRSLTEPLLLGGVPRSIMILNGTLLAMFVMALHSLYIVPLCIALHLASVMAAAKDAQFFDCLRRYIHKKTYYSI